MKKKNSLTCSKYIFPLWHPVAKKDWWISCSHFTRSLQSIMAALAAKPFSLGEFNRKWKWTSQITPPHPPIVIEEKEHVAGKSRGHIKQVGNFLGCSRTRKLMWNFHGSWFLISWNFQRVSHNFAEFPNFQG